MQGKLELKKAQVQAILSHRPNYTEVRVNLSGTLAKAVNYDALTGEIAVGDWVYLNTTAVSKKLGTGGWHFVLANLNQPELAMEEAGHIMKLRYTPMQVKVLSVEEEEHPLNPAYRQTSTLAGTPVIIGTLHSMLPPLLAALNYQQPNKAKIIVLMTDGAALPAYFSRNLVQLREKGLMQGVVTCGHAFGGDWEAVNNYSGLLAAKAAGAEIILACMGPGIVGTGSAFGFTGIEQGELVNAVQILGGRPLAIPRLSFADPRPRHWGLSHHTQTALGRVALKACEIVFPQLPAEQRQVVEQQIRDSHLADRHQIIWQEAGQTEAALQSFDLQVSSMGRKFAEDPAFFQAAAASGFYLSGSKE